jgi:tripartite-type tricarboxylate transporter receptor subunit TctC
MRVIRTVIASCAIAIGILAAAPLAAWAKWPMDRPMTIVVPWPAGTGADLVARLLADGIGKKWGNQVIVENKVGATGNIAQNYVAKAAPDGYTYIVTTPGPAANNMLTFKSLASILTASFVTITTRTRW